MRRRRTACSTPPPSQTHTRHRRATSPFTTSPQPATTSLHSTIAERSNSPLDKETVRGCTDWHRFDATPDWSSGRTGLALDQTVPRVPQRAKTVACALGGDQGRLRCPRWSATRLVSVGPARPVASSPARDNATTRASYSSVNHSRYARFTSATTGSRWEPQNCHVQHGALTEETVQRANLKTPVQRLPAHAEDRTGMLLPKNLPPATPHTNETRASSGSLRP